MFYYEPCKTALSAGRSLGKFSSAFQNARAHHQVQWPSAGGIAAVWPSEIWVCNGRRSRNHDFRGTCRNVRGRNPFRFHFGYREELLPQYFQIVFRNMNTQPVVMLGFTPNFSVTACQVLHVDALFFSGGFSQQPHFNWLSITFVYLVCSSLETGNKTRVTSSDQSNHLFFNQSGNKNQTNHGFTHSRFPRFVFPPWRRFRFPALFTACMFSRAWHQTLDFPPFPTSFEWKAGRFSQHHVHVYEWEEIIASARFFIFNNCQKRLIVLLDLLFLGDAYHITAPSEGGYGAYLAMKNALRDAGLKPKDIHYINAHATSTPLGKKNFHFSVARRLRD